MLDGWFIFLSSLIYLGLLFLVASYGDRRAAEGRALNARPEVYVLAIAVYCTSWTFYGSVGLAAATGYDFLPIYLGPILMFTVGWPVLRKILYIAKSQNITSIADFVAARYGKSQIVAVLVTLIAVIGAVPYIALQLKAVATNFNLLLGYPEIAMPDPAGQGFWWADTATIVAAMMALFAILFGTRKLDTTEHHEGMVLAIAFESVVKLAAFMAVGFFVTFMMFDGFSDVLSAAAGNERVRDAFLTPPDPLVWLTTTFLAMVAIICLPRQFHVAIVENTNPRALRSARWLFPAYLVAINIFVIPIALAGLIVFDGRPVDGDTFVQTLPMEEEAEFMTLLAFLGGLSAATGMVIVATVALSTMVCNDLVVPFLLRRSRFWANRGGDATQTLLFVRRMAIASIIFLAWLYYRFLGEGYALASIGLLSFAAVAQFAPALFGGVYWARANRTGAIMGIGAGFAVWYYTLMLPTMADAGLLPQSFLIQGLFGADWTRPRALFGVEGLAQLTHGVMWSLLANLTGFIGGSLLARVRPIDTVQSEAFLRPEVTATGVAARRWTGLVTVRDLKALATAFVGRQRVRQAFGRLAHAESYNISSDAPADLGLVQQTERLLTGVLGSASARLVMAMSFERHDLNVKSALSLLDDATAAIRYNRELLQSTVENVSQGIAVFDNDLRLICRNARYLDLQDLPPESGRLGVSLQEIIHFVVSRGEYGPGDPNEIIEERVEGYSSGSTYRYRRTRPSGMVLEAQTTPVEGTGVVVTLTDITEQVQSEAALREANENLERWVEERTRELRETNQALERAKLEAEEANRSKTKFLAAASHDLLQPLNAARLFTMALSVNRSSEENSELIGRAETSLTAVDDLLSALLDISKLDAGAVPPKFEDFAADDLLSQLKTEFAVMAEKSDLDLRVVPSSLVVRSDPKLLRRVLQNLLSNAIRYAESGKVLMGCRRNARGVRIEVWDTGPGIPAEQLEAVFEEFRRLDQSAGREQGAGLGLAIVERIARTLGHEIDVQSWPGKGTVFSVGLPVGNRHAIRVPAPVQTLHPRSELEGRMVLCIDNEQSILDGMNAVLDRWGARVLMATDMVSARRAITDSDIPPDLIIADYHLAPGEKGVDAVQDIRLLADHQIPAIVVTADRSDEVRNEATEADCQVLNKPVKPGALRALMMRQLAEMPSRLRSAGK